VITATLALATPSKAEIQSLPFRTSAQQEVAPAEEIVDGQWIVIGNSEKSGGRVFRDTDNPYGGQPVYRFSAADDSVNRIEFSEVFGSTDNLKGLSDKEVADLLAIRDAYANAKVGRYGDTVTYEWSTRFPEELDANSQAIIAQWHGRPDRTLVDDGKELRYLSIPDFVKLTETYDFRKDGWGYDKSTGKRSNFRVDGAAGGPIAALKIGFNYMYLLARSDASRRSSSEVKLKPKPMQEIGHRMQAGLKEASLVWKLPLSAVPINEWIDFRVRIRYSEYSAEADEVLSPGSVDVWMNGKQVAAWKGNIGKNDILGPYFKFGIYKPGKTGFNVDHAAYRRTIQCTRLTPVVGHGTK
jgi:heparin lyase